MVSCGALRLTPLLSAYISHRSSLLLANENVVFTSPVTVRTSSLPAFLAPNATKRRQLILTDFPRLFAVKEDAPAASGALTAAFGSGQSPAGSASQTSGLSVKNECIIVPRPSTASAISGGSAGTTAVGGSGGANRVMDVVDKGAKGFVVQTVSSFYKLDCLIRQWRPRQKC